MKCRLLTLCLLTALSTTAQDRFFNASLQGGFSFSQVDGDALGGYNKPGLHGGFTISHKLNENWISKFELNYIQKGSKRYIDPEDQNQQIFILAFDYLELPILLEYQWDPIDLIFGYSIGNNIRSQRDEGLGMTDIEIKSWEHALQMGAKYTITDNWEVELRHSYSLFRVGSDFRNGLNIFNRVGIYNRLFALRLNYLLGR